MEKQFYRIEEMATMLDVSRGVLKTMRERGDGPPYMQPSLRIIRYPICGYDAWKQRKLEEPKKANGS